MSNQKNIILRSGCLEIKDFEDYLTGKKKKDEINPSPL